MNIVSNPQMDTCSEAISRKAAKVEENQEAEAKAKVRLNETKEESSDMLSKTFCNIIIL